VTPGIGFCADASGGRSKRPTSLVGVTVHLLLWKQAPRHACQADSVLQKQPAVSSPSPGPFPPLPAYPPTDLGNLQEGQIAPPADHGAQALHFCLGSGSAPPRSSLYSFWRRSGRARPSHNSDARLSHFVMSRKPADAVVPRIQVHRHAYILPQVSQPCGRIGEHFSKSCVIPTVNSYRTGTP